MNTLNGENLNDGIENIKATLIDIESTLYYDPNNSLQVVNKLISNENLRNDSINYLEALRIKSMAHWQCGNIDESFYSAVVLLEEASTLNNEKYKGRAYNAMGIAYYLSDNQEIADKHYLSALECAESANDLHTKCSVLNNMGELERIYSSTVRLKYLRSSNDIAVNIKKMVIVYDSLINIAFIQISVKAYDEAISTLNKIVGFVEIYKNDKYKGLALETLSQVYFEKGDMNKAIQLNSRALDIFKKTGHIISFNKSISSKLEILIALKRYEEAITLAHTIIDNTNEVDHSKFISDIHLKLSIIYELLNDHIKSLYECRLHLKAEIEVQKDIARLSIEHYKSESKITKWQDERRIYKEKNLELKSKNNELHKMIKQTQFISKTGREITSTLVLDEILNLIYKNINKIVDVSAFYVGIFNKEEGIIEYPFAIENSQPQDIAPTKFSNESSLIAWVIRNNQDVIISDAKNEDLEYLNGLKPMYRGDETRSIMVCLLYMDGEIIGVLSVQSMKIAEYTAYDLDMTKALASFISVALKNSEKSEKLKIEIEKRIDIENTLRITNTKLINSNYTDELTKIANRRWLMDFSTYGFEKAITENKEIALMMIDIDYFKEYNDHYGHVAGDECLIKVATLISECLNEKIEHVVRYGGDEFIVVIEDATLSDAYLLTSKIHLAIESAQIEHDFSKVSSSLSISIGSYIGSYNSETKFEYIMYQADQSLYVAKAQGRNQVVVNQSLA